MKSLFSVFFALAASAVSAHADSAYFLPTNASPTRSVVSSITVSSVVPTDRVSVAYRPMASVAASAKTPMDFIDRRYVRGSAQAAIVR